MSLKKCYLKKCGLMKMLCPMKKSTKFQLKILNMSNKLPPPVTELKKLEPNKLLKFASICENRLLLELWPIADEEPEVVEEENPGKVVKVGFKPIVDPKRFGFCIRLLLLGSAKGRAFVSEAMISYTAKSANSFSALAFSKFIFASFKLAEFSLSLFT